MKILIAAEEAAGAQAIRAVRASGHTIVAVMTTSSQNSSAPSAVQVEATRHGLQMWDAELVQSASSADLLIENGVDILLNVHSLYIVHAQVLKAARVGAFNLHPGPLPQYSGLNVVNWAIFNGETRHASTLHWMVPRVDAGAIAYEAWFDIDSRDSALKVYAKCARAGIPLVEQMLVDAERGAVPARALDLSARHYYSRRPPNDGYIDWTWPASRIANFVRACDHLPFPSPWGFAKTRSGTASLEILRANVTGVATDAAPGTVRILDGILTVAAADQWIGVERMSIDSEPVDTRQLDSRGFERFE